MPLAESGVYALPTSAALRQLAPLTSGSQYPQHGIRYHAVIFSRSSFLTASFRWQKVFYSIPFAIDRIPDQEFSFTACSRNKYKIFHLYYLFLPSQKDTVWCPFNVCSIYSLLIRFFLRFNQAVAARVSLIHNAGIARIRVFECVKRMSEKIHLENRFFGSHRL